MKIKRTAQVLGTAAAALFALAALAVSGAVSAAESRRDLENAYQRSFHELTACVVSLEGALSKAAYANTPSQQSVIAAKLIQQAGSAKASLSALPLRENTMDNVQKFLSQTEDFSAAFNKKIAAGGTASKEDREHFRQLYDYAALLKADLLQLQEQFEGQTLSAGESTRKLRGFTLQEDAPDFGDSMAEYAADFTDYPTMIYDGPFSDHILQRKPKFLENKKTVSEETAVSRAADFFHIERDHLKPEGEAAGNLPAYLFSAESRSIRVTKQGGEILSMLDSRAVSEQTLTHDKAKETAEEFLRQNGFGELKESYYVVHDNLCTMQFFAKEAGVTLYPDLIKVSVALDNGDIMEYDAAGYLMNRHERELKTPALPLEAVRKNVSPLLTIKKESLAIIPTPGKNEVLCYEFLCTGAGGEEVLVYLNADTGMEEEILILLRSDDGVLTI